MDDIRLLIDLFKGKLRQGPGGEAETVMAVELAGIDRGVPLAIADIGCGTGASTLALASLLNAHITAVDFLQDFLDVLESRAQSVGVADRIDTLCASMEDLPFVAEAFDVIWSEGAIYNMGFQKGVADWRNYLKPGGLLVVSELTWLTGTRPAEIQRYWDSIYPEIDLASAKIRMLEQSGYAPLGYFALPEQCWRENYYHPLQTGFGDFLERNGSSGGALAVVEEQQREIALYERYKSYYGYGVYIARRVG
ncbi:methyltransferase domain-containing protein [Parahaliea maris]|uniref:Methyltransferase domain-containing protein n=1 Tax=Parahaliea maris TaxID=2716870 RepID=A0A5C9A1D7_9GAMM|nr:class I SAM-dependent methyltransferase [Parahaliea maris]TXS93899.1 methyltransferase domain-containing protein [Parahaliea maris]